MADPAKLLPFLKPIHLFYGLSEAEIKMVALELEEMPPYELAEEVFTQGSPADAIYFIAKGRATITRRVGKKEERLATLVKGDYFGEGGALTKRMRTATVTAEAGTSLYRLPAASLRTLLKKIPILHINFDLMINSRRLARQLHFRWLDVNEVIYYLGQKHEFVLYQALALPIGLMLIPLVLLLYAFSTPSDIPWLVGLLGLVGLFLWALWCYIDWGNDYYIVTNQRVIRMEKVIGLYDSRDEAPLSTILSVGTTASQFGQWFDFGDVTVRTFGGPIVLTNINHPKQAAAMVEEYWKRTKSAGQDADDKMLLSIIRNRIKPPEAKPAAPAAAPSAVKQEAYRPSYWRMFVANMFKLRFEDSNTITYRKHWFVLVRDTFMQMLIFLILVGGVMFQPSFLGGYMVWFTTLMIALLAADLIWWWYDYEDWVNDIYQVTPDQVIDVYKKPFGVEDRKSAPLEGILATEYQRNGLIGILLNYGTVFITVGGAKFDFVDVFDPPQVQQDILRRKNMQAAKKAEAARRGEIDKMAEWLVAYHKVAEELRTAENKPKNPE